MPLDAEVKAELDSIRRELFDELRSARTPREREAVRSEAAADLDDVLRANGYRLSRRELDEIMAQRDDDRIAAAVDRRLAAIREAERDAADDDESDESDESDDAGEKKKPAAKKPAAKKPAADGQTEEEEWV
jgi:hypothetical protein